jgi:four helix bundle protein
MARPQFENLRVYQLSEELADLIWNIVLRWEWFAQKTVGEQLVTAADSIGANISEGAGRGSFKDNKRFVKIARGSLNETQHWLRRAFRRNLLSAEQTGAIKPLLDELGPKLNAYLKSIGRGHSPTTRRTDSSDPTARTTDNGPRTTDKQ